MIREEEALAKILAAAVPLPAQSVALANAFGRFSAAEARAQIASPPFDNSAVDGYAIIAASVVPGGSLKISGEQPAGVNRNLRVGAGEAVRIFTGAPLPAGADAVVMQEETEREADRVLFRSAVTAGEFVRRAGGDLAVGQKILAAGERISASTIGLLASQGMGSVEVGARASVGIIITGDELVPAGQALRAGEIYESNGPMLRALAEECGAEVRAQVHCPDDFEELCAVLDEQTKNSAVIVSGGVSVGERDFVRAALRKIGAEIDLWRVAIKPGKPFLFGRKGDGLIFGLPGNPVSSFVTFLVLVRPALMKQMGAGEPELFLPRFPARLGRPVENKEERAHYLRGHVRDGVFIMTGRQESHALFGLSAANALLRLESGSSFEAGAVVEIIPIG